MKILITGAHGQLGNSLQKISSAFPQYELINTDIDTLDISNEDAVATFFTKVKPEYVVNCAAYTAVDKAETDKELSYKINALAPGILGRQSAKVGASFIHISTDYVFDGTNHQPYTPADATNPLGIYGVTKKDGEDQVLKSGKHTAIIRTAWLYSEFGNNFVKTMLKLSNDRPSIHVVADQIGSPTYASDLAEAVFRMLEKNIFEGRIFHFTNEGVCSWYDLAHEIMRISGKTTQIIPIETWQYPTPAKRPAYSVLSKTAIKAHLEYTIPHWSDSLRECMKQLS